MTEGPPGAGCEDKAQIGKEVVSCAREAGHKGMHIGANGETWSPGMGIRRPHVEPPTVSLAKAIEKTLAGHIDAWDDNSLDEARDDVVGLLRSAGVDVDLEVPNPDFGDES